MWIVCGIFGVFHLYKHRHGTVYRLQSSGNWSLLFHVRHNQILLQLLHIQHSRFFKPLAVRSNANPRSDAKQTFFYSPSTRFEIFCFSRTDLKLMEAKHTFLREFFVFPEKKSLLLVKKSKVFKMSLTECRVENSGKTSWKCVTNTQFWFLIWLSRLPLRLHLRFRPRQAAHTARICFPSCSSHKQTHFLHSLFVLKMLPHSYVYQMLEPLRDERKLNAENLDGGASI